MFPWKLLFRFFSAMVLVATGGFAAGHAVPLSFASPPAASAPATPTADSPATTTAPDDSNQSDRADGSTTTTTAPDSSAPVVEPVADPAATSTTVTTSKPTTTTAAPKATKGTQAGTPPAVPVPGDASSVCAAAATTTCGPAQPTPADDTHAARVQRCQDWWNSLADAFDKNGEPQWAAKAREIAGQCDAMITRWEQLQQEWAQKHDKGDHNGDGHPDDGKGPNPADHQAPPPPPQPKQGSHQSEGRH